MAQPFHWVLPKRNESSHPEKYKQIFMVSLFIIIIGWKQSKYSLIANGQKIVIYLHDAIRKNKLWYSKQYGYAEWKKRWKSVHTLCHSDRAAITKKPHTDLTNRNWLSLSAGGLKSGIKVLAELISFESSHWLLEGHLLPVSFCGLSSVHICVQMCFS